MTNWLFGKLLIWLGIFVVSVPGYATVLRADGDTPESGGFRIIGPTERGSEEKGVKMTIPQLEALGIREQGSTYFDRAMDYRGSRFRVVSFSKLVDRFDPEGISDAVLLNCFDDYQGLLSIRDIKKYDVMLATRIEIHGSFSRPDWLNPLLVIVPDGVDAPFQERFLTANIRELRFVRLDDYYGPLTEVVRLHPESRKGYEAYRNNCQFCHSLKGVGGNKGGNLPAKYDLFNERERYRFNADFESFHNKKNPDKQNVEQFLTEDQLEAVAGFLRLFADGAVR